MAINPENMSKSLSISHFSPFGRSAQYINITRSTIKVAIGKIFLVKSLVSR